MTEALKYDMQQRTNIEFERQRHIANWLIESSPHMPKIVLQKLQHKANSKKSTIAQTITTNNQAAAVVAAAAQQQTTANPIFFLNKIPLAPANLPTANSQVFTSQTNLPLQILSTSRDGQKTKLRRFNSHDTSANMFSVADFENARLARRNELEMRQRQQRHKLNSLSSGGDCSTGDSKGSKYSCESVSDPLPADLFLERFSLPRVVRLSYSTSNYSGHETLQSSSSNDSNTIIENKTKLNSSLHQPNGELFLLYRYLKDNKVYHAVNTKSVANRRKGLKIPQDFSGYFSLVNEKGAATATLYTTMVQLVRERVYKFVSIENLTAYTETYSTDNLTTKTHYVKGNAKAGQIFRLLAVFQDGGVTTDMSKLSSSQKDTFGENTNGREKDRGRYAQLLSENRQIIYVSLATKGKFYEIEHHAPHILQKSASLGSRTQLKSMNPDCVHKINNIITADTDLPLQLKFICSPQKTPNVVPENVVITKITTETSVIACPIIDEAEDRSPLHLRKIHITPNMKLVKCFLGFENEQRMFSNQNVQNILKFCQYNCDTFARLIDFEYLPRDININIKLSSSSSSGSQNGGTITEKSIGHHKERKLLSLPKFLRHDKSNSAHEKEDSIIFLSKNELENLETQQQQQQKLSQTMSSGGGNSECGENLPLSDKMKVFQPNKQKKWFKNLRSSGKTNSFNGLDCEVQGKGQPMERYKDMSKLIQERFGDIDAAAMRLVTTDGAAASTRANSEFGYAANDSSSNPNGAETSEEQRQKSMSLQEIDVKSHSGQPDLVVNIDMESNRQNYNSLDLHEPLEPLDANSSLPYLHNVNQSFISDKLFSEFHVKTKQYSKSSSHLHQLLHFAMPQRGDGKKKLQMDERPRHQIPPLSLYSKNMDNLDIDGLNLNDNEEDLSMFDDLPYSSVRDSILLPDPDDHKKPTTIDTSQESEQKTPPENIYAEICGSDGFNFNTQPSTSSTHQHRHSDSVKISIRSSAQDGEACRRHRKTDNGHDIYHIVD